MEFEEDRLLDPDPIQQACEDHYDLYCSGAYCYCKKCGGCRYPVEGPHLYCEECRKGNHRPRIDVFEV